MLSCHQPLDARAQYNPKFVAAHRIVVPKGGYYFGLVPDVAERQIVGAVCRLVIVGA